MKDISKRKLFTNFDRCVENYVIRAIALSIILGFCINTLFATTKRTFKNEHYAYIKKKEKKISRIKSATVTKTNPKNVRISKGHTPQPNIDIHSLSPGVYFLYVKTDKGIGIEKVIKNAY